MRKASLFALLLLCAATPADAKKVSAREEIQKLHAELDQQRALLVSILQTQQAQLDVMIQAVQKGGVAVNLPRAEAPAPAPVAAADPDPPARRPAAPPAREKKAAPAPAPAPEAAAAARTGAVAGSVQLSGGAAAWVYVEDIDDPHPGEARMTQKDKGFEPRVLVVERGSKIEFPNSDPIFHNVFSVTPGASFDLGSYHQGESRSVTVLTAGQVNVFCNLHPQMIGTILTVPNRHYARVKPDGTFRLEGVPSGKHRVAAWAPGARVTQSVEVAPGADAQVSFKLAAASGGSHLRKDGTPYGSYDH